MKTKMKSKVIMKLVNDEDETWTLREAILCICMLIIVYKLYKSGIY